MDLWCSETSLDCDNYFRAANTFETGTVSQTIAAYPSELRALPDDKLLKDCRVLENLLTTEDRYTPSSVLISYKCVQKEIQPHMRKILAAWLMDVSSLDAYLSD